MLKITLTFPTSVDPPSVSRCLEQVARLVSSWYDDAMPKTASVPLQGVDAPTLEIETIDSPTDEDIVALRAVASAAGDAETVDWCNRALGAPIYEAQSWHQPRMTDRYKRCQTSREICARLIAGRKP